MNVDLNRGPEHSDEGQLSGLFDLLAALRRRWPLVLICAALVPAVAVGYSLHKPKIYTANASLLFGDQGSVQQQLGYAALGNSVDPTVELATDGQLTQLPIVARYTAAAMHGRMTLAEVTNDVSVSGNGQSSVFTVTASNTDPRLAAQLANTYAQQFVVFLRNSDRAKVESARELIERQIALLPPTEVAQRSSLQHELGQLQLLAALQTGNAQVVQAAQIPTNPSSPSPVTTVGLGLVLGLLLGVGIALLADRIDRKLRDPEEISRAFDRPILATIPESGALARQAGRGALGRSERVSAEAFRTLYANLRYFNVGREINTVLITSAGAGEGRSTIALHLAMAAADAGTKTLLIEADWRDPVVAQRLDIDTGPGLGGVLLSEVTLEAAVARIPVSNQTFHNGVVRSVDVLAAGPERPNAFELLGSERTVDLLIEAQLEYDLLVIDTPPISVVSDAAPLVTVVSGVVVVAALATTTRDSARDLRTQLGNLHADVLGVVANSPKRRSATGSQRDRYSRPTTDAESQAPMPSRPNGVPGFSSRPRIRHTRPTDEGIEISSSARPPKAWP